MECKIIIHQVTCTPGDLDDVRDRFRQYSHFTIGNGKAEYHMIHLPDRSCGIYYAVRIDQQGHPCTRRAMEPTQGITVHGLLNQGQEHLRGRDWNEIPHKER